MIIIDGKQISDSICDELIAEIKFLHNKQIIPTLAIIQIGDYSASNIYVRNKLRLSDKLGAKTNVHKLPVDITQAKLIELIHQLNNDDSINGILVQMPLPAHINETIVIENIHPNKDVDCFHWMNVGKLWTARKAEVSLKPCTPFGIIQLLKYSKIDMVGKHAVIIGRSNIVGKPMASLLLLEDATVTICHSRTPNLSDVCKQADILICAIGKANMIDHNFIKPNAVVIDVGMNRDSSGRVCGDVHFNDVKDLPGFITPVPGGVGPMTITMLMYNLLTLTKLQKDLK